MLPSLANVVGAHLEPCLVIVIMVDKVPGEAAALVAVAHRAHGHVRVPDQVGHERWDVRRLRALLPREEEAVIAYCHLDCFARGELGLQGEHAMH